MGRTLPDFPVDEATLVLLDQALDCTVTGVTSVTAHVLGETCGHDYNALQVMYSHID